MKILSILYILENRSVFNAKIALEGNDHSRLKLEKFNVKPIVNVTLF